MNSKPIRFLKKIWSKLVVGLKKIHADFNYAGIGLAIGVVSFLWFVGKIVMWTGLIKYFPAHIQKDDSAMLIGMLVFLALFFSLILFFIVANAVKATKKLWDES